MGYHRAGFEVVGVDVKPQPHYPFEFIQADAIEYLSETMAEGFDAIHASPPCQAFTSMRHMGKGAGAGALDLVEPTRAALIASDLPWIIENVVGAPLRNPVLLCGSSFGLGVRRHRLFESSEFLMGTPCRHRDSVRPIAVYGDHPQSSREKGTYRVNRARTLSQGQDAMGIDWMPWKVLTQAIPPAMTEYLGRQLLQAVERAA